jgi:2-polyprenyl-6-methoxyphenol hydroxylase-like FAD-dependent oxidoreductase
MDKLVIIGGGVAGLSLANFLQKKNIGFNLYEKRNESVSKGHGFIITDEGLEKLSTIIDIDLLYSMGNILNEYSSYDNLGKLLENKKLDKIFVVSRSSLLSLLESNLPKENMHLNKYMQHLEFDSKNIKKIYFDDGTVIYPSTVIAADGSRSRIREQIFPDNKLNLTQVNEIVNIIEDTELAEEIGDKFVKFHHEDGGLSFGVMKISESKVIWYTQFDIVKYPLEDDSKEGILAFIKKNFGDWCHPIPYIIRNTKFDNAHYWRVFELDELSNYYSGNAVFIGDTAHPLVPFTSQGVASALEDSKLLVDLLAKYPDSKDKAIKEYSENRKNEMKVHLNNGRLLSDNFLLPLNQQKGNILPISYK